MLDKFNDGTNLTHLTSSIREVNGVKESMEVLDLLAGTAIVVGAIMDTFLTVTSAVFSAVAETINYLVARAGRKEKERLKQLSEQTKEIKKKTTTFNYDDVNIYKSINNLYGNALSVGGKTSDDLLTQCNAINESMTSVKIYITSISSLSKLIYSKHSTLDKKYPNVNAALKEASNLAEDVRTQISSITSFPDPSKQLSDNVKLLGNMQSVMGSDDPLGKYNQWCDFEIIPNQKRPISTFKPIGSPERLKSLIKSITMCQEHYKEIVSNSFMFPDYTDSPQYLKVLRETNPDLAKEWEDVTSYNSFMEERYKTIELLDNVGKVVSSLTTILVDQ